jgi:7,8-dihydro-6-hydroxymethylpterin dimethyltransferase
MKKTKELETTFSVCPLCYQEGKIQKIPANIIEDEGKVWMIKQCQHHGSFKEIYFNDVTVYNKWMKYKVTGKPVPDVATNACDTPALYAEHLSQTVLTNLVVTNRCNLNCEYCHANAGASQYVYEPTLDELKILMQQTRNEKPFGSKSIQITGGEPTLREDLFEIIRMAKELGFSHVQIQTNGVHLAENSDFCQRLVDEQVDTIYMSFNGVTRQTNPLLEYHKKALEHLKKVHANVVLVPVLIGGKNLHEAGKIVRFALDNIDVVRGVHFQPISFCGRASKRTNEERNNQRVEYVQIIDAIEKEFPNLITRDDFYPTSILSPISQLFEWILQEPLVEFTPHPGCGGSTFIYINEGLPVPITRFLNVETIFDFINEQSKKKGPLRKLRLASALVKNLKSFTNNNTTFQGFNLKQITKDSVIGGRQYALRDLHHKTLIIGAMWYQDVWNLNIDRLQRCVVHCSTPEGIIPFCSYMSLGIGEKIQEKYSIPVLEWEKRMGRRVQDDLTKDIV